MQKAFSIIEMLVSVGILLILSAIIVSNPNRAPQFYDLVNGAQRVEAELRKTQGFALATKDFKGAPPAGGWGIHFVKTLGTNQRCYIIFADDGDGVFEPGAGEQADPCNPNINDTLTERYDRIFLPITIDIANITFGGSVASLDIVYRAPRLDVVMNTCSSSCVSPNSIITLQSKGGGTKGVIINEVGNVEAQ